MNKKLLLLTGAAITSIGITTSVMAVQATGTATAAVVVPMTITNTSPLEFGDIIGGTAGTVIITAAGAEGGGTLTSSGIQSAGTFDITGANNRTFSIGIAKVTELVNGTDNLVISAFTNTTGGLIGTLSGTGTLTLGVGATITADGSEPDGPYSGTYTVDVDYN